MPNISIGRFDGCHCSGRLFVSANRLIVAGELQYEARESDTLYSLAIATAVSLSGHRGRESWWAAGDIYMSVQRAYLRNHSFSNTGVNHGSWVAQADAVQNTEQRRVAAR